MRAPPLVTGLKRAYKPHFLTPLFFSLMLLSLPQFTDNSYILNLFTFISIYAIMAASFDLIVGYTGQISLGHPLFFGVGGYTLAILNLNFGVPWWAGLLLGTLAAAVAGFLIGVVCLRFTRLYLAIVTFAFTLLAWSLARMFPAVTGGELGLSGIARPSPDAAINFYLSVLLMVFSISVMYWVIKSRWGLMFQAIREDEPAAKACGINTTRYKILAFILGSSFAGLAGGFYVSFMSLITADILYLTWMMRTLLWWGIGGEGTLIGPVLGAYFLTLLGEELHAFEQYRLIIFGTIFILVLYFLPTGIYGPIRQGLRLSYGRIRGLIRG